MTGAWVRWRRAIVWLLVVSPIWGLCAPRRFLPDATPSSLSPRRRPGPREMAPSCPVDTGLRRYDGRLGSVASGSRVAACRFADMGLCAPRRFLLDATPSSPVVLAQGGGTELPGGYRPSPV